MYYFPALKLLKSDLTDIAKEATVDPKYILLYFYYGALILTAVKVSIYFIFLHQLEVLLACKCF